MPHHTFSKSLMILGLFAAAPIACSAAQSRGSSSSTSSFDSPKPSPASVAGTVVQLAGSMPIKSATVRLESAEDFTHTISGTTDVGGNFEIKGIAPGKYFLHVMRAGFVTQQYGQKRLNDAGAILSLRPGQNVNDLLFRLVPSAVISGRIEDEDGNPLPWVRVSALREIYLRGRRRLLNEVTVVTNDLGEYRLFGLRPGRYFVLATYKPGQRLDPVEAVDDSSEPIKSGYVPTYFPGSPDMAKALPLTVKTGEELSSMSFSMEQTTVFSVRGHVNILGVQRSTDGVTVVLEPRTTSPRATELLPTLSRSALADREDGSFAITNVLPGSYALVATWFDAGRKYQARQSVDITAADPEGIHLTLTPGWNVLGQVLWDPKPSLENGVLAVRVRSVNTSVGSAAQMRVAANGTFALRELPEGTYELATFGQTADCYLKSIRYAGMEVSDDQFNVIRGTQATLEVTISAKGARVQGSVTNEDGLPAVGVWVVLVPQGARRDEFHLFKQITTDQYGRFDLRGIAPGDYQLFSWEQVEANAWEDPEFLRPFEGQGQSQSLSLQESEAKQVNLVAIRTANT